MLNWNENEMIQKLKGGIHFPDVEMHACFAHTCGPLV